MARCTKLRKRKRQVCVGGMQDRVILQNRSITPPVFGDPDFSEAFQKFGEVWATVNTVNGKTFFDGVGKETVITHTVLIEFDATVTDQTWIILEGGRRLNILEFENLDERSQFLRLTCADRGPDTLKAAEA